MFVSFSTVVLGFLSCALFVFNDLSGVAYSREIEATNEWTLLGENDTIPAGLHIRMDMTTGQKWVKLIDDNGKNLPHSSSDKVSAESKETSALSISTVDDKGAVETDTKSSSSSAIVEQQQAAQKENENDFGRYDFDMMHKTLSGLPEEELNRIGGLPKLPGNSNGKSTTPEERALFEKRMAEIWTMRQEELREWEQNQVADMPKILKDRIQQLHAYLQEENPMKHLQRYAEHLDDEYKPDEEEEEIVAVVTHVVSVLQDLEHHLTDLDMARDFHTLGGWPLLVSLMSRESHIVNASTSVPDDVLSNIEKVQIHAAWAVGSAVKNIEEFSPWAVEPIELLNVAQKKRVTTALSQSLELLLECSNSPCQQKALYALGSLLRGNPFAQQHLLSIQGAEKFLEALLTTTTSASSLSVKYSPRSRKVASRILALVDDLMTQRGDEEHDENLSEVLAKSFSTDAWCEATLELLVRGEEQVSMAATRALHNMLPYCGATCFAGGSHDYRSLLLHRREAMETGRESYQEDIQEITSLLDGIIEAIDNYDVA